MLLKWFDLYDIITIIDTWRFIEVEEKIEHNIDENYEKYLESFIKTKDTFYRKIPNMRGVVDFDYVDESSKDNMLSGYSVKYCVRANVMFFRDLIKEIHTNPDCSYKLCYTNEEVINGDIPNYFSVFMKEPVDLRSIEAEVYASRILNYFGTPVVYNRRVDKAVRHYGTTNYLMSIDMIRRNEKLVLLNEIVPFQTHIDIGKFEKNGLKETLDVIGEYLKIYLDNEGVLYTEKEIEDYKKYLSISLLDRVMLLGDSDFRNGNTGILVDVKNKRFRAIPNFDMEKSFGTLAGEKRFESLKEFYELFPEEYDNFIHKMLGLFENNKKGEPVYYDIAKKSVRSEAVANSLMYKIYENAEQIWNETMNFRKNLSSSENVENSKDILA